MIEIKIARCCYNCKFCKMFYSIIGGDEVTLCACEINKSTNHSRDIIIDFDNVCDLYKKRREHKYLNPYEIMRQKAILEYQNREGK